MHSGRTGSLLAIGQVALRVGINILYLLPGIVGGTETYAAGLLHGLASLNLDDEFFIFANRDASALHIPKELNAQRIVCGVNAKNRMLRYAYEQLLLPRMAARYKLDVMHSLGYTGPLNIGCKSIVTIHDLNFVAFGHLLPVVRRAALGYFVKRTALGADHIITVSEFSRTEISRILKIPEAKITVTYEAPNHLHQSVPKKDLSFLWTSPYWVTFTSEAPNKNVPNLLRAIARVRKVHGLLQPLVLVGHPPKDRELQRLLRDGSCGKVFFTGYLDTASLGTVLGGAQMLVFPSIYEGFGLPIVEAMAAGVPVACSRAASLPEIAGDAARFFDPTDVESIAETIADLSQDECGLDDLRKRGVARVQGFSWAKMAKETMQVYRGVLS